ncbi:MAG TPA: hypothetical protein VFB62_10690 [Polyangiaceae bacterium]|nr:hypothetical protein [Polyangiaceae bacterium]
MSDADRPSEPWPSAPESTLGDGPGGGAARVVLLADRSSEGDKIVAALRGEGFSVITSDVVALPERIVRLKPFATIVDLEQPHAEAALHHLHETDDEDHDMVLVGLGSQGIAERLSLRDSPRVRILPRPVGLDALVAFLREAASYVGLVRTEIPPSESAPEAEVDALLWEFSARAGLPEVESLLPDLDSVPLSQGLAGRLSPDIEALLDQGARRVRQADAEDQPPTHDADIAVPDELLSSIDELLSHEDISGSAPGIVPREIAAPPADAPPPSDVPVSSMGPASRGKRTLDSSPPQTSADLSRTSADLAAAASRDEPSDMPPTSAELAPLTRPGRPAFSTAHPSTLRQRRPPFTAVPSTGARSAPFSQLDGPFSGPSAELTGPASSAMPSGRTHVQPPLDLTKPDAAPSSQRVEEGEPIDILARAVRGRATGALLLSSSDGTRVRRILLREGDLVNAASDVPNEALLRFLIERGDLRPEVAELRSARLPSTGRHAAAALIANGFLGQDDLWPVLRAHAEWIITHALHDTPAICQLEREPPERLRAEPNVFGGAAGVEVFVEAVRRVLTVEEAVQRLGGADGEIAEGPLSALLSESALSLEEMDVVRSAVGSRLAQVLAPHGPELAAVLYALVALEIFTVARRRGASVERIDGGVDPLDDDAIRERVRARLALVQEGDYFALLGVRSNATGYDIRRAYLELRRFFEPGRLLNPTIADLTPDVELIAEVLEEAYQVLRDPNRRSRYRRAIEASAPST